MAADIRFSTPRADALGLATARSASGLTVSRLPNGSIFEIGHRDDQGAVMINQVLGSPVGDGIGRIVLRRDADAPVTTIMGGEAESRLGAAEDGFLFEGERDGIGHSVELRLDPEIAALFFRVTLENRSGTPFAFDLVLAQDIGLGGRGFLMGSEAYASQYIDHHPASHARYGPVVMCRQNLKQGARNPWLAVGGLDGAAA
ncbi:MAG: cellobiose phosphorylase, partial [Rhizobiales bacterium]|nr:cellobiose phosphorylase [Hyphomicrobiales bacterium]